MYSTFLISNYIIKKFNGNLNLIKLQVLLYFTQGWSLFYFDKPIINEKIRLVDTGIRIDSVYYSLVQRFGLNNLVNSNDYFFDIESVEDILEVASGCKTNFEVGQKYFSFKIKDINKVQIDEKSAEIIDQVIAGYGKLSYIQLYNMIHLAPHPFAKYKGVYSNIDETYISEETLKETYIALFDLYCCEKNDK